MNEAKLEKQKKNLVEMGVMEPEDTLLGFLQANYVARLMGPIGKWRQGWAYFTEERLIVLTGLLDYNIVVPYKNIRGLGKCTQSLFPIGIVITYTDIQSGETITDKVSMMKRDKWLSFMAEKAGIAIS